MIYRASRDKRIAMNSKQQPAPKAPRGGKRDFTTRFGAGNLFPIVFLVSVSLAVYFNSLGNGFVFDDYAVIVENEHIQDLKKSLPAFFSDAYFEVAAGEASYRPAATLSYFLIHSIAGLNPFYYHLSSVLLHALNVILVYLLSCALLQDRFKALLAGLLFACHPALTETVNCIAFNEDLLAGFFFLLAFILYAKRADDKISAAVFVLSLFFFFCALLSKEMAITLPLIILFYDVTFREIKERAPSINNLRHALSGRWLYYLGYAVVAIVYLVLRFYIIVDPANASKPNFGPLFERLIYLPNHIFSFIKLVFAPYNLNVEYVFSYPQNFFEIGHLIGLGVTLGLAIGSLFFFRRFNELFFGIWWFLITLFPVYNIIEIFNPLAERYLYIPLVGFCLVVPVILDLVFSKLLAKTMPVKLAVSLVVLVIISVYAAISIDRNRDWQDGFTLWSKTVTQSPESGVAHGSLGRAYQERGMLSEAIAEYETAVKLMPNHYKAYYNMGVVYDQKGEFSKALDQLKMAININPHFANAHYNLAVLYFKQGSTADAIRHFNKVIELEPEDIEARNNLGVAYAMQGNLNQALVEWENVLKIDPTNQSARDNVRKAKVLLNQSN